jgi:hypothetical protein
MAIRYMLIEDQCRECGLTTVFGSGRFVNRVRADGSEEYPNATFMCPACLAEWDAEFRAEEVN